ncbi:glutamate--tRNA ligase-like [Littorina saxatilis]|uniref:Uncharacterized protein n=1 Tax=Littorina saxatilis TaxID=31220 RepID=A0AAN9BTS2_9CAEN
MRFQVDGSRLLTIQCVNSQCRPFTGFVVVNEDRKSSVFPILKNVYILPSYRTTTEAEATTTEETTTQLATTPIATTEVESTETTQLATTPIATTEVESTETTQLATTPIATTEVESTGTSEAATVTQNNVSPAQSSTTSAFNNNWASRCNCRCLENVALTLANSTSQKAQQTKQQIQDDLLEDRKQLSSYIRSKTSAPDERKSALVVGSTVGIVVFIIVLCLVVLPDFLKVCWYVAMRFRDRSKQN